MHALNRGAAPPMGGATFSSRVVGSSSRLLFKLPSRPLVQQQQHQHHQPPRAASPFGSGGGGAGGVAPYEAQETIFFFGADGSVSRVPGRRRVVVRPLLAGPPASPFPSDPASSSSALDDDADDDGSGSGSGLFFLSPSAPASARAIAGGHLPMPTPSQQGICVASTFSLQATNGRDPSRRISFEGFVQLPEVLEEAVEASVLSRGGEVLVRERGEVSPERLASRLRMRVAVPLLFGVPEEWQALRETIESAGGIVHRLSRSWGFYAGGAFSDSGGLGGGRPPPSSPSSRGALRG